MSAITKQYETKLDSKKRLVIRKARFSHFLVKEFDDGHILLEPQILVSPDTISKNTLEMIDESITNLKSKKVSDPINLDKYLKTKDEL